MSNNIVEGVFAIHKPQSITSAQVIRDVQVHFKESALFAPWLKQEKDRLREARAHHHKGKYRKDRHPQQVKIGHGGTLDPMATGVLILGVGSGTKRLSEFLSCTKSYDTVVLFGQSTDTYDVSGKTVARKDYAHITKEQVEEALKKFQGSIMQRPPIYSALRVQGKHLYEYAREGKEVPIEIKERPVTVEQLELVEWYPGGTHEHHWPTTEADPAVKEVAAKVLDSTNAAVESSTSTTNSSSAKRERESEDDADFTATAKKAKNNAAEASAANTTEDAKPADLAPCPAPACRLRMTVTSGFYVRSLCHDLGAAVDSLGTMASLVRTRQGEFTLGENVFEYADLEKSEEHWGPIIGKMLAASLEEQKDE